MVKSRYREQIRALSALNNAAPIKKERSVVSYNRAREDGLSEQVIRAGWQASGLCPYNPRLVLHSSQISGHPSTPRATSQEAALSELVFITPQSSQALCKAQQQLLLSESLSRSTQLVLSKAHLEALQQQALLAESENYNTRKHCDFAKLLRRSTTTRTD